MEINIINTKALLNIIGGKGAITNINYHYITIKYIIFLSKYKNTLGAFTQKLNNKK